MVGTNVVEEIKDESGLSVGHRGDHKRVLRVLDAFARPS